MFLYIFEDGNVRLSPDRSPTPDDIDSIADGLLTVLEITTSSSIRPFDGEDPEIEVRIFDHDSKLHSIEDLRDPL